MKILLGMPSKDSWGGPIASEPPFAAALRRAGNDVREEVYVYGDKEKPTKFFARVRRVLETAYRFRKILKTENFDIIHLNTAFDLKTLLRDSATLFLLPKTNAKIFLKIHGSESKYLVSRNLLVKFLHRFLNQKVDGFGVHTREEKANFTRAGFDVRKFYFVKNAVTISEDLPPDFARKQKARDEIFQLLFVSRFVPTKGLLETIRACAILKNKNLKFILHAVGDGETRRAAESEAENSGLTESVEFTGYISEEKVAGCFFDADIFVFPTRHAEGFPNVLFKAVAAGMPIVTTEIRAAADYLSEPENCLFSTQEPEIIAEKIFALVENENLRIEMSRHNLAFGKTLAPENIAREFLEIYEAILRRE